MNIIQKACVRFAPQMGDRNVPFTRLRSIKAVLPDNLPRRIDALRYGYHPMQCSSIFEKIGMLDTKDNMDEGAALKMLDEMGIEKFSVYPKKIEAWLGGMEIRPLQLEGYPKMAEVFSPDGSQIMRIRIRKDDAADAGTLARIITARAVSDKNIFDMLGTWAMVKNTIWSTMRDPYDW